MALTRPLISAGSSGFEGRSTGTHALEYAHGRVGRGSPAAFRGGLSADLVRPAPAGPYLRYVWAVAAFFSGMALLQLLRVGSYEGTTDEEVDGLIRQGYWVATGLYLCLLAASLLFIFRPGAP